MRVQRRVSAAGTSAKPPASPAGGTESAARVADVMLLFLRHPSLGVTDIAYELGLGKTVVHRILQSLESRALVRSSAEDRLYHLGTAAVALGARALQNFDLREVSLPVMRALAERTGETVVLSALVGSYRVYVEQVVSPQEIKMTVEIGRPFPLHAGASSRAILAFTPPELQQQILTGPLPRLTPKTLTDAESLSAALDEVRRCRVAVATGERQQGSGAVAAPIFGADRLVVGAISVCGPLDRFQPDTRDRYTPWVLDAAAEISRQLGYRADATRGETGPRL